LSIDGDSDNIKDGDSDNINDIECQQCAHTQCCLYGHWSPDLNLALPFENEQNTRVNEFV
jgi:hypothetical protein